MQVEIPQQLGHSSATPWSWYQPTSCVASEAFKAYVPHGEWHLNESGSWLFTFSCINDNGLSDKLISQHVLQPWVPRGRGTRRSTKKEINWGKKRWLPDVRQIIQAGSAAEKVPMKLQGTTDFEIMRQYELHELEGKRCWQSLTQVT